MKLAKDWMVYTVIPWKLVIIPPVSNSGVIPSMCMTLFSIVLHYVFCIVFSVCSSAMCLKILEAYTAWSFVCDPLSSLLPHGTNSKLRLSTSSPIEMRGEKREILPTLPKSAFPITNAQRPTAYFTLQSEQFPSPDQAPPPKALCIPMQCPKGINVPLQGILRLLAL